LAASAHGTVTSSSRQGLQDQDFNELITTDKPVIFAFHSDAAEARYWTSMERHKLYTSAHGEELPEIQSWRRDS
jgi:phosphoketolase